MIFDLTDDMEGTLDYRVYLHKNLSIVALDELLLQAERCSRFSKLCQHRLEQRPNRIVAPERSLRREIEKDLAYLLYEVNE